MIWGIARSRALLPALFLGFSLFQGCAAVGTPDERPTAQLSPASVAVGGSICRESNLAVKEYFGRLDSVKQEQPGLVEALTRFPKGADLHNHLSGTVRPDAYIDLAEGDCFGPDPNSKQMNTIVRAIEPGKCQDGFTPLETASVEDRQGLMRSLSMYQFNEQGVTSIQDGHDQFFATFDRFGAVSGSSHNRGPMLALLLRQAKSESVSYVETMVSFQSGEIGRLADLLRQKYPDPTSYTQSASYPALFEFLLSAGLQDAVGAARKDVAGYVDGVNSTLQCGGVAQDPACEVEYAFQASVNRNAQSSDRSADLPKIFTQTALSYLLADTERRVVGVNLLSGEDQAVSMHSFDTQMQFFRYFHSRFPRVNLALHGGEITPCFVGDGNPALKTHITEAIQAGAKRVGHAVSFTYLNASDKLEVAELMKRNDILVEIPLTSNAQILGVTGATHPFPEYVRTYGVAVALATDDAGVSYSDFTSAWIYAVSQYRVTFAEAVRMARASLQYSFLPGDPLWQDIGSAKAVSQCAGETVGSAAPGEPCKTFIAKSAKARMQWRYEGQLSRFDSEYGASLRKYLGN
jgi:adenosine deaminase